MYEIAVKEAFSVYPKGGLDVIKQEVKMCQKPQQPQTIEWVGEYIKSERARWETTKFREMLPMATREQKRDFKILHFGYATFSGIFTYRNARSLISRSPFLTLDIDNLSSTKEARKVQQMLIQDPKIETALCFVSPSGLGVKWIVRLPEWVEGLPFREQFVLIRNYVGFNYGIDPDKSGSDVCRACFLPWDEECYINPKYVFNPNNII